jgi:hypothetical protein
MLCFFYFLFFILILIFQKKIDFFFSIFNILIITKQVIMSTFETFKWSYRQTLAMEKTDKKQEMEKLGYEKLSSEEQQRLEAEWATEKSHREKHKHNELHNAHEKQVVPVLTKLLRINELLREAKELAESYDEAIDCETCYNDCLTPDSRFLLRTQCLTLVNSLSWTLNDCDNARNTLRDTPIEFQFYPSGDSL